MGAWSVDRCQLLEQRGLDVLFEAGNPTSR
jgi:hypothetical protein